MLFTQLIFWKLFLITLALVYLNSRIIKSNALQSVILLVASYIFYGYWDYRFLALIFIATAQTYLFGYLIYNDTDQKKRKFHIAATVIINIGILFVFKYFNFFIDVINDTKSLFGSNVSISGLKIILPVGISFYIFQTLTFVLDIASGKIHKFPNALHYFTYVSFFPQLVAGPIERASHLLPQFEKIIKFKSQDIYLGCKLIIFGLFLKAVIADSLGPLSDGIFANYNAHDGGTLLLGVLYFSGQIYGDFCGYSTIAIGVARIIGFDLMVNFRTPYLASSITDFWRRWHISLSTFFRDYLYIPLGGSRGTAMKVAFVTMTTFVVSGLWHGAAWGFIAWGALHGMYLLIERKLNKRFHILSPNSGFHQNRVKHTLAWMITMCGVGLAWIFFRQETLTDSFGYFFRILTEFSMPSQSRGGIIYIAMLAGLDLLWNQNPKLEKNFLRPVHVENAVLGIMLASCISTINFANEAKAFIYFQF
jgi:D-alanyl-lipoteichoic acid acyltransferase DltB (MBOAT superfamily)